MAALRISRHTALNLVRSSTTWRVSVPRPGTLPSFLSSNYPFFLAFHPFLLLFSSFPFSFSISFSTSSTFFLLLLPPFFPSFLLHFFLFASSLFPNSFSLKHWCNVYSESSFKRSRTVAYLQNTLWKPLEIGRDKELLWNIDISSIFSILSELPARTSRPWPVR